VFLSEQAPADSLTAGKRAHPSAPGDHGEEGPRLNLVTALPLSVWREQLRPLLSVQEAARLRALSKAIKALVMGWPMHLGNVYPVGMTIKDPEMLEGVLTCFPATEGLTIIPDDYLAREKHCRMVELLMQHGGTLKVVRPGNGRAKLHLWAAVLTGALPNLTHMVLSLREPCHRQILSNRMLGLLEDVEVTIEPDDEGQIAALGHLRHLPHLRRLTVECATAQTAMFPPFIPPWLKSLKFVLPRSARLEALLRDVPSMLRASGASIEEIEMFTTEKLSPAGAAVLAQVLQACSRTLKTVELAGVGCLNGTASSRELMPGILSCCDTLEVLHCRWDLFSALSATGPTFPRLTELQVHGGLDDPINLSSPAWDIMANGRLPALARLCIKCEGLAWEGAGRLARAFEAVGGTLRRFAIMDFQHDFHRGDLPAPACHELGAAIGKLRRLRHIKLYLFSDGRMYTTMSRGLATSGGCPELLEAHVYGVKRNVDWLTYEPSLFLVPSVRTLYIGADCCEEKALLLGCGLVRAGYKNCLQMQNLFGVGRSVPFPFSAQDCVRSCRGLLKHVLLGPW
jgi:hypothetical protein